MRILQSSVFRAICAIIIGILLIQNPDNTVRGITIAIGVLFLLSGAISCAVYFASRMNRNKNVIYDSNSRRISGGRHPFPIVGLGSVLFGLVLALMPDTFVTYLMYVLGAILIIGALNQFMNIINANKTARLPLFFWICPSITLLVGVFVVVKPMESAALPMLIIGWCLLFYGVTECVNAFRIYRDKKRIMKELDRIEKETVQEM